jgi:hypothetical protein
MFESQIKNTLKIISKQFYIKLLKEIKNWFPFLYLRFIQIDNNEFIKYY